MPLLDDELVLYLPFSEGSGSKAYDKSKHQNHGTINGALHVGVVEGGSGWLLDWDKRLKITIDADDIDSDLTDFPILIHLGTSVGIDSDDVSCVFDEVGANSLKIAVTDDSGVTQCYVEVERWDNGGELAWLWVKVPSISSSTDTILYLYYDNDHADNTTYVGIPNSAVAENVWNSDFKLVTHMLDDPDNANVRDSTTNDNDGAKEAAGEPAVTTNGKISDAQHFDGVDDGIVVPDDASLAILGQFTIEMWIKLGTVGLISRDITNKKVGGYSVGTGFALYWDDANNRLTLVTSSTNYAYSSAISEDTNWHHLVVVINGTSAKFYWDNVDITVDGTIGAIPACGADLLIGKVFNTADDWYGDIDEYRLIATNCTEAWIKASYETERDHLITFSSEYNRVTTVDWRHGNALSFDGVNDYVNVSDSPELDFGLNDSFSISLWVKLIQRNDTAERILTKLRQGANWQGYYIYTAWSGYLYFSVIDTTGTPTNCSTDASHQTLDSDFHHLVCVRNTTTNKIYMYLDGELASSLYTDNSTETLANNEALKIGIHEGGVLFPFEGIIDEPRIYRRALTPEEIKTLYLEKVFDLKRGLMLHTSFSEASGSKAYDKSKHQNNGDISGALAVGALEDGSGWLLDWDKRLKITIDADDIDSDLTDFPILISLGTSVGIDSDDVSCVFDEVGANSLKIAVTDDSGVTQCYVEVERWDNGGELAWLWVKVPSISSSTDTVLYLYYDNDHADNTTYVGAPNSAAAENVWDADFVLVTHMQDDPDNAHVRDSTTNDNDATKKGANEPVEAAGKIDKGQDFDGGDDYIKDDNACFPQQPLTLEAWVKTDSIAAGNAVILSTNWWRIYICRAGDDIVFNFYDGVGSFGVTEANILDTTNYFHIIVTKDNVNGIILYVNGQEVGTNSTADAKNDIVFADQIPRIGANENGVGAWSAFFDGIIDEVRISDVVRSVAYVKASYESERDHLVTFSGERDQPSDVNWRFGKVLHFDGVNDCVEMTDSPSLNTSNVITISAWINPKSYTAYQTIVSKYQSAILGQFYFCLGGTSPYKKIRFLMIDVDAGYWATQGLIDVPLNTWTHVAVTYDMDKIRLYVNGVFDWASNSIGKAMKITTSSLFIGKNPIFFDGLIDEVRVYSRVLTPEEIKTLYEMKTK